MYLVRDQFYRSFNSLLDSWFMPTYGFVDYAQNRSAITDDKEHWTVRVNVPGFTPNDVSVKVEGNYLTLRAERKSDKTMAVVERSVWLPDIELINLDQVTAAVENGLATIVIPKPTPKQHKVIPVK